MPTVKERETEMKQDPSDDYDHIIFNNVGDNSNHRYNDIDNPDYATDR